MTILHTASEVISFTKKLEEDGAKQYENLAEKHTEHKEILQSFSKENLRNIKQVEGAYYGSITDAFESCFTFEIETDEYMSGIKLKDNISYSDALDMAAQMEESIIRFYSDAAQQSKSLLADVARFFSAIAQKRGKRLSILKTLKENRR